jgi:hypothetical protein
MHLNMALSVMNYSNIAFFASELFRLSSMLYQVEVFQRALLLLMCLLFLFLTFAFASLLWSFHPAIA